MGQLRKDDSIKPGRSKMNMEKSVKKGGRVIENGAAEDYAKKSKRLPTFFVFLFSTGFAALYSEFYVKKSKLLNAFEDEFVNKIFFGPGYAPIFGEPSIDQILGIFVRGLFFMLIFGLSPYLTYLYVKSSDSRTANIYYMNWGVITFTIFALTLFHTMLGPLIADIYDMFSME